MRFLHNTYYLIHNTQRGFAPIALVVLLLLGIGAGTYLVQNRTNFLPKAQEKWDYSCDEAETRIHFFSTCANDVSTGLSLRVVTLRGGGSCEAWESLCDKVDRPCDIHNIGICKTLGKECEVIDKFNARCVSAPAAAPATNDYCTLQGIKDGSDPNKDIVIKKNEVWKGCDTEKNKVIYLCKGGNKLDVSVEERSSRECGAPAPAAPAGQTPGISDTACSASQVKACLDEPWQPKGGCVITTGGRVQCKYEPSREGDKCNNDPAHPETGAVCGNTPCFIIDGLPRCITGSCSEEEKKFCGGKGATCEIGEKIIRDEKKNYTYCKPDTSSTPATGAPTAPPAGSPDKKGGDLWDQDLRTDKHLKVSEVLKKAAQATSGSTDNATDGIYAAQKAQAAYINGFNNAYKTVFNAEISADTSARTRRDIEANYVAVHSYVSKENPGIDWNTAKSKGLVDKAGKHLKEVGVIPKEADLSKITPPDAVPGSTVGSTTTGCENFKDAEGIISIPCYKIGVFTPEDLKATEAQAKVALERYTQYKQILSEVKGQIDTAIEAKAREKIEEAEKKANACIAQK